MLPVKITKTGWHLGILAGLMMAVYGLYPQFVIVTERGDEYNGVFASNDLDESAYASYLQALIDGRPRKNDPYSGRDASSDSPQHESIFSIQFAAPYVVAIPARLLGISATQAFIATSAIASFLTALAVFWLVFQITSDHRFAAVAVLIVLLGGALASGNGAIIEFIWKGGAYPYLPFLRRYIPAVAFPFFFASFGFVWLALKSNVPRIKYAAAVAAAFSFAFTVYSYFYLWTTAAAFIFALTILLIAFRPENWRRRLRVLLLIDTLAVISLVPYAYLLSNRAPDIDSIQLLVLTHAPDLFRVPAIVCYVALCLTGIAIWLGYAKLTETSTLFLLAFCLVPLIVFNQQVITGLSLQPFHYEFYVVNYVTSLVAVLTIFLFINKLKEKKVFPLILAVLTATSLVWGYFEVKYTTENLVFWNVIRDEAMPVNNRLAALAKEDEKQGRETVTLNYDYIQADNQTTVAPQAVLWARHQHVFAGVPWEENKERFYQLIYYADRDADWLREDFRQGDIEAFMALFGWDRFNSRLSVNARPLTSAEIEEEVQRYQKYYENFSRLQASNPKLSLAVIPADAELDLTNLRKWYELGEPENHGKYDLYKLTLR